MQGDSKVIPKWFQGNFQGDSRLPGQLVMCSATTQPRWSLRSLRYLSYNYVASIGQD